MGVLAKIVPCLNHTDYCCASSPTYFLDAFKAIYRLCRLVLTISSTHELHICPTFHPWQYRINAHRRTNFARKRRSSSRSSRTCIAVLGKINILGILIALIPDTPSCGINDRAQLAVLEDDAGVFTPRAP